MRLEDVDPRWKERFTEEEIVKLLKKMERKRQNAKRRGIEFTLTVNDWLMLGEKLLVKGRQYCGYTGLPLSNKTTEFGGDNPWFPTVERIDDKVGYCSGNLCICCERANLFKDIKAEAKNVLVNLAEPLYQWIKNGSADTAPKQEAKPQPEPKQKPEPQPEPQQNTVDAPPVEEDEPNPAEWDFEDVPF